MLKDFVELENSVDMVSNALYSNTLFTGSSGYNSNLSVLEELLYGI